MKNTFCYIFFYCAICFGCQKKHRLTSTICDNKTYIELYNVNKYGVDEKFITDSIFFRSSLGTFDNEHEQLVVNCKGDSVIVEKWDIANETFKPIFLERKVLIISNLKKEKIME